MQNFLSRAPKLTAALLLAAVGLSSTSAMAQCQAGWVAGDANSNMSAPIRWLKNWDPDGAGPMAPLLVAAGDFFGTASAGTADANYVATWDGTSWAPLGTGLNGAGYCLTTLSGNNRLYVSGASFSMAGDNPAKRIASWDGASWASLDTGEGNVPSLALLTCAAVDADSLVVSGAFTSVAGVPANRVALYNVVNGWSALGSGMSSTTSAVCVMPNGDIIAGGAGLTTGDGAVTLNRIGRWDGSNWNAMGTGLDGLLRCLIVMPNGDLIAGGAFNNAGGVPCSRIARWNGSTWSPLGSGLNLDVYALAVMPNGDLVAAGDFTAAGAVPASRIARWNGSSWSAMGSGFPAVVRALEVLPNGDLAAGGDFMTAGGQPSARFARWSEASPISITEQPVSAETRVEDPVTFTVTATGSGITYKWQQQDLFTFDYVDINDGPVTDPFNNVICYAQGTDTNSVILSSFNGTAQMFRCLLTNSCGSTPSSEVSVTFVPTTCIQDFNGDGDSGTDQDIEAFFACLGGTCCPTCGSADFNGDGDTGTDQDIESFFRVLGGGDC